MSRTFIYGWDKNNQLNDIHYLILIRMMQDCLKTLVYEYHNQFVTKAKQEMLIIWQATCFSGFALWLYLKFMSLYFCYGVYRSIQANYYIKRSVVTFLRPHLQREKRKRVKCLLLFPPKNKFSFKCYDIVNSSMYTLTEQI